MYGRMLCVYMWMCVVDGEIDQFTSNGNHDLIEWILCVPWMECCWWPNRKCSTMAPLPFWRNKTDRRNAYKHELRRNDTQFVGSLYIPYIWWIKDFFSFSSSSCTVPLFRAHVLCFYTSIRCHFSKAPLLSMHSQPVWPHTKLNSICCHLSAIIQYCSTHSIAIHSTHTYARDLHVLNTRLWEGKKREKSTLN